MEVLQRTANRGSISTGPYEIDNSMKVENDNREYLRWTNFSSYASSARKKKFTMSCWLKRTEIGRQMMFWSTAANGYFSFDAGDTLIWYQQYVGSGTQLGLRTTRVFRDTSAWYHLMIVVDTAQSTEANRVKMYVNGVQETVFGTPNTYPSQGAEASNLYEQHLLLGEWGGGSTGFSGYIAEYYFLSEIAASPTDLGEFDEDTGIWIPKKYSGTITTPSHFLEFKDGSDLGTATSGLDADTMNNLTAADQATDTCTNNFCTWNPLWVYLYQPIISEGATKVRYDNSTDENAKASIGLTNGKWYWEAKPVGTIGSQFIGIQTDGDDSLIRAQGITLNYTMTITPTGRYYSYAGSLSESSDQGWDLTASDWLGIALDMDSATQTIKYYKNGSLIQSLNLISQMQGQTVFPFLQNYENRSWDINFGGYTINTISSAASDGDGHGTFEYAPPSSHFAICTKNLAEYG